MEAESNVPTSGENASEALMSEARRGFCRHGTNFIECWRDRGTSLIGAANLSPVTNLVAGTGAVSRYKLSRSQKFITVQDLNWGQMRVPVLSGAKCLGTRTITNLS
jgi:hypothetical protein